MEMGEKIRMLRLQKGLTLEELGNLVGVGKSTVRKWENGMIANMRRDKIVAVAKALEVTPGYLMGWEDGKIKREETPIDPRLVQIAKQMCRQDPVVLDVYDSEDRGKLVDYAELLYGAQDGRHLAIAAHSSAGKVKPETMAQMEDDDLWK